MPDSGAASPAVPPAARAGFCTLSPPFSPTHFHEEPKEFEAYFLFQILNLAGQRWLRDTQPPRRTPVMLFLTDRHEISQMPQFHSDTLPRLV